MASLSELLRTRQTAEGIETNLQPGDVFYFNPGTGTSNSFAPGVSRSWTPTRTGSAVIEVWGASGSAGKQCCCGNGVGGNPGAYSKKVFTSVTPSDTFTMVLGQSCANNQLCYKGVSEPTLFCWTVDGTPGVICAQGGNGGTSACSTSSQPMMCCLASVGCLCKMNFESQSAPYESIGAGCGMVCNYRCDVTGGCIATACGGDINKDGGFSCTSFHHCQGCCMCYVTHHVRTSPGIFSQDGNLINIVMECGEGYSRVSGNGIHQLMSGLNNLSRHPVHGMPPSPCWSNRRCSCYEDTLCSSWLPHGVPGIPSTPCNDVRDYGFRGGHGAVRITLI
jgi:hypothetical protein